MDSSKLSIKIFLRDATTIHADSFVPVFHRWIQTNAFAGHHLLDVADYKHVPDGPGTVLVAQEANLYIDSAFGKTGLLYQRKMPIEGDLAVRLKTVFQATLLAAKLLEAEPSLAGKVVFKTDRIQLRIHDRLEAPNTAETFAAVKLAVEGFLTKLYGGPVRLSHERNDETLFEINATGQNGLPVAELLGRVS